MLQTLKQAEIWVLSISLGVAVCLLTLGAAWLWRDSVGGQARLRARRLAQLHTPGHTAALHVLRQPAGARPWLDRLNAPLAVFLQQAGVAWRPAPVLAASLLLAITAWAGSQMLAQQAGLLGLAAGLLGAALPGVVLLRKRHRRLALLQRQMPEALDLMARAMQAGHAFGAALHMVGQDMAEPMAGEFRLVHDEVNFGMGLQQALANLTQRVPLNDLRYFSVAVLIQRDSGGNLSQLLGNLAQLIRERLKLLSRVRVLSSEGRLSSWILVAMPFALGGLLAFFSPDFMRPLWTDPLGLSILNWMLGLMALGLVCIQYIVRLRV